MASAATLRWVKLGTIFNSLRQLKHIPSITNMDSVRVLTQSRSVHHYLTQVVLSVFVRDRELLTCFSEATS